MYGNNFGGGGFNNNNNNGNSNNNSAENALRIDEAVAYLKYTDTMAAERGVAPPTEEERRNFLMEKKGLTAQQVETALKKYREANFSSASVGAAPATAEQQTSGSPSAVPGSQTPHAVASSSSSSVPMQVNVPMALPKIEGEVERAGPLGSFGSVLSTLGMVAVGALGFKVYTDLFSEDDDEEERNNEKRKQVEKEHEHLMRAMKEQNTEMKVFLEETQKSNKEIIELLTQALLKNENKDSDGAKNASLAELIVNKLVERGVNLGGKSDAESSVTSAQQQVQNSQQQVQSGESNSNTNSAAQKKETPEVKVPEVNPEDVKEVDRLLDAVFGCSADAKDAAKTLNMMYLVFENLRKNPTQDKYRKVNTSSSRFKERFATKAGNAEKLLEKVGFVESGSNYVFEGDDLTLLRASMDQITGCLKDVDGCFQKAQEKAKESAASVVETNGTPSSAGESGKDAKTGESDGKEVPAKRPPWASSATQKKVTDPIVDESAMGN